MSRSTPIVEIKDYSLKAVAIFSANGIGDKTKKYSDAIKAAGGKFNPSLAYGEDGDKRIAGWIFPKTLLAKVEKLVNDINGGKVAIKTSTDDGESKSSTTSTSSSTSQYTRQPSESVDKKAFMALVSRVEQLEQELYQMKRHSGLPVNGQETSSVNFDDGNEDDGEEDDEERPSAPAPRLLKRRFDI